MTPEQKKQRIATVVKWAIGLVAAAVISPVIFFAVKGIVGLALALVLGVAFINFAPVVAMKFANWKLKGIKHEAMANPVETMQNVFLEKTEALAAFLQRIEEFATQVSNFSDKLDGFKAQFPAEAPKFQSTLDGMQRLLQVRRQKYGDSKMMLSRFSHEIAKADAIWKMGLAAQAMTRAAGMTEDDFMQRLKTETAIDSVQTQLNRAMAELETSLLEETPVAALEDLTVVSVIPQMKERVS